MGAMVQKVVSIYGPRRVDCGVRLMLILLSSKLRAFQEDQ